MKPFKTFQLDNEGKISFTEEELLILLEEVYQEGYIASFNNKEEISNQVSPYIIFLDNNTEEKVF